MKLSPKRCFFHGGERAATCQTCYDLAQEQQRAQVAREREQAHTRYLHAQDILRTTRQHLEIES